MLTAIIFVLVCFGCLVCLASSDSEFWKKHIVGDFDESGHPPECFDCHEGRDVCFKDASRCAAMNKKNITET